MTNIDASQLIEVLREQNNQLSFQLAVANTRAIVAEAKLKEAGLSDDES